MKAGRCLRGDGDGREARGRGRRAARWSRFFSLCCCHLSRIADCASICDPNDVAADGEIHWPAGPTLRSPSGSVKRSTLRIVRGAEASHTFARISTLMTPDEARLHLDELPAVLTHAKDVRLLILRG